MRKSWLFLTIMTLLLRSNGALALVDISGKEKVVVSSWGELKTAVADAGNAGKVIVLNGDITADVNNPIDVVGAEGVIIDGGGFTITGQTGSNYGQFIKFYNKNTDLIIQNVNFEGFVTNSDNSLGGIISNTGLYSEDKIIGDISGNFKNNSLKSTSNSSSGGVIGNVGIIGNITGDFENNSTQSENSSAEGGAIYNGGMLGDIIGDFRNNSVQAEDEAQGGAIYNSGVIGDISGDFTDNYAYSLGKYFYIYTRGGAIYNVGTIGDITGNFEGNYASGSSGASGGAISNSGTIGDIEGNFDNSYASGSSASAGAIYNSYGTIGDISGNFENNSVQAEDDAQGGAIYNSYGTIGDISGNFENNSVQAEDDAQGGAIYNEGSSSQIGTITGDFSENYAQAGTYAQGGAIYNDGTPLTLINSSFTGNSVVTTAAKDSADGQKTQGGAIYTTQDLTIKADKGQSIFSGNKVKWADGEESSAIYLAGISSNLSMDAQNGGKIQFDDKIVSGSLIEAYLQSAISNGAMVTDDGKGGYIIEQGGQQMHLENDNGTFWALVDQDTMPANQVDTLLPQFEQMGLEVTKKGENYYIDDPSGLLEGVPAKYEFIVQDDGNYLMSAHQGLSPYGGNITISGDEGSQVVFNNAIENIGTINISGTKVEANEGVGTIARTITSDKGVLNINKNAKAEDSIINQGGTMNVADSAEAYRTEVNEGGVLNVASGGLVQDTTVNTGGKLTAASQAMINNMLANDGAILELDKDAYLTGNIIIHAAATMGGSYDYSQIFKDEVTDKGSLTLVGGLNATLNESSLVNTTEAKKLNLTAGDYAIGDGTQAVEGWDVLTVKDNATVKLEGDIAMSDAKKKLYIENGSTLDLAGHSPSSYTITGSLVNDGLVTFSHVDDEADDTTTVYGNYIAYKNAQMTIDVNPQTNTSDLMIVDGDVQGSTLVNLNVLNEAKPSEKILFVEALNDNPATGAAFYTQDGHIFGSPYKWNVLYENNRWYVGTDDVIPDGATNGYGDSDLGDITDDTVLEEDAVLPPSFPDVPSSSTGDAGNGNNSVVFRKPSVVGEVIAYMGLPSAGIEQTRDMTRNVSSKVASTKIYSPICHGYYDCEYNGQGLRNAWASPVYSYSEVKSPYKYDAEIAGLDAGLDLQADAHNRLGVFVSSRNGNYDFDGKGDDYYSKTGSEIDIDSYILGLYYRYDGGKYWAMSQVFGGYQDVDIASDDGFGSTTDGIVFGGSFESGLTFTPRKDVVIEPTMRVGYTQINYDKLKDNYGKTADFDDVRNIELEAGVKIEKAFARERGFGKVYIKPSVIQNIGSGDVNVTGLQTVEGLEDATLGRVEVGGSMSFNDNWSAYLFAAYTFGSDYKNASINAGLNYAF